MFDVREVRSVRAALEEVMRQFDAALVPAPVAASLLDEITAIEAMAATAKALLARRVAETEVWRRNGDRSPAHHLARVSGTSVGDARRALETAERLAHLPATAAAARRGHLSSAQVAAIADAASVAPHAEADLLSTAHRGASLGELRDACERAKAAALDAEERHRRAHAARALRRRTCGDGSAEVTYRSTPEEVAEIWSVAEAYANAVFRTARAEGRCESHEAYLADGLLAAARAARRGDAPPGRAPSAGKVIVRIDWTALVRGSCNDGDTCEIAGIGPVPVSVVRHMIASGDAFLAAIATKGVDVATVAHLGRRPTAFQQTALEWLQPTCTVLGCDSIAGTQIDHRDDWATTKRTSLAGLDRLCRHHHDLKTYDGWKLVSGAGKRPMVPPGDPSHPDRARTTSPSRSP